MYNNNKYAGVYLDDKTGKYYVKSSAVTKDGYKKYFAKYNFKSKSEALNYKISEALTIKQSYKSVENNSGTFFYDVIDVYLDNYQMKVAESTFAEVKGIINNYIKPAFKNVPIKALLPKDCRNFKRKLFLVQMGSSSKNVRLSVLRKIITFANQKGYIDPVLMNLLLLELDPFISDGHASKNGYWEIDQFKAFIDSFSKTDVYYYFFLTMFNTGARMSEIRALKWTDFNPIKQTLTINKQTTSKLGKGHWVIVPHTKTKLARTVKLPKFLVDALLEFKALCNFKNDNAFIFMGENPISEHSVNNHKKKHCELAKVPYIRNHDFRHSYTVYLFDQDIDAKTVATQLGHTNVSTTLDVYNHVSETRQDKLKTALDNLKF